MATHRLYIGANNTTKEVEIDSLKAVLNTFFDGYSLISSVGSWKGVEEKSVVVEIATDEVSRVSELITTLKSKLQQESIGYMVLPELSFR